MHGDSRIDSRIDKLGEAGEEGSWDGVPKEFRSCHWCRRYGRRWEDACKDGRCWWMAYGGG